MKYIDKNCLLAQGWKDEFYLEWLRYLKSRFTQFHDNEPYYEFIHTVPEEHRLEIFYSYLKTANLTIEPSYKFCPWEKIVNNRVFEGYTFYDFYHISQNKHVTWDIVMQYPNKPWNFNGLSKNPNITWSIIKENLDKPWNWTSLSSHPNITWDIIAAHPKNDVFQWDWLTVSQNPNITWEIIVNNLHIGWYWGWVSCHPCITPEIIDNNLQYPWIWNYLSSNPNITPSFIDKHLDKIWFFRNLITNSLDRTLDTFLIKKEQEFFQQRSQSDWKRELMEKRFHPKNISLFENWGFI